MPQFSLENISLKLLCSIENSLLKIGTYKSKRYIKWLSKAERKCVFGNLGEIWLCDLTKTSLSISLSQVPSTEEFSLVNSGCFISHKRWNSLVHIKWARIREQVYNPSHLSCDPPETLCPPGLRPAGWGDSLTLPVASQLTIVWIKKMRWWELSWGHGEKETVYSDNWLLRIVWILIMTGGWSGEM